MALHLQSNEAMGQPPSTTDGPWPGSAYRTRTGTRAHRLWRRLRWVVFAVATLLVITWALYRFALPVYVGSVIDDALEERGFGGASFELRSVSLGRLSLANLRLDDAGRVTASEVTLDYDLSSLWHGRVKTVSIRGARWHVEVDDDRAVDLGLPAGEGTLDISTLPLDRLEVLDSTLTVSSGGAIHRAELAGTFQRAAATGRFDIEADLDGAPARASGTVTQTARGLDLDAVLEVFPLADELADSHARVHARYKGADGSLALSCELRWPRLALDVAGRPLELEGLTVSGDLGLSGSTIRSSKLRATSRSARFGPETVRDVALAIDDAGENLAVTLAATDDGWTLDALTASVGRDVSSWPPASSSLTWSASGVIPGAIAERLRDRGIAIDLEKPAIVRGHGALEVESTDRWTLAIAGGQLEARASSVDIAPLGLRLRGVEAVVGMSGTVGSDVIDISVASGSAIRASILARADGRTYSRGSQREPALALTVHGAATRVRLPMTGAPDWSVEAPSIDARLRGAGYSGHGVDVRNAGGTLRLGLTAKPGELIARARRSSPLSITALRIGSERPESLTGCRPTLLASGRRPLLRLLTGKNKPYRLELAASARCQRATELAGAIDARISGLAVSLRGRFGPGTYSLSLPTEIHVERLSHADLGLTISDAAMALPLQWGSRSSPRPGSIRIGRARWRDRELGSAQLSARQVQGRALSFDGSATLLGAAIKLRGGLDGGEPFAARVALDLAPTDIDNNAALGELMNELVGARIAGRLSGSARITAGAGATGGRATFRLRDATLSSMDGKRELVGIETTIVLDSLRELRTARAQRVRWKTVTLGDYKLGAGWIRFAVDHPRRVIVDQASVATGKGRLSFSPFAFDPKAIDIRTNVSVQGVRLERWLPVLTRKRATGTGTLDGTLPLRVRRAPLRIALGDGSIEARGKGCFKIGDVAALTAILAAETLEKGYSAIVRDRIIQSLSDFCYRRLRFDLEREGEATRLRISTDGKGRKVSQELDLTVNINGFEELLDPALRMLGN